MTKKIALITIIVLFFIIGNFSLAQKMGKTKGIEDIIEKMPQSEFLHPKDENDLKGDVKIEIKAKEALSVEFYLRRPESLTEIYLGKAIQSEKDRWEFNWDTAKTPNGSYYLFAKITNQYGEYDSEKINIEIANEILREKEKEEKLKIGVEKSKDEIKKEEEKITEKKEEVKKEVVNKSEELAKKTTKLLEEEQKKIVEPKVNEKLEAAKEKMEEHVENLVNQVKEEKKVEKEIEKKEEAKEEIKKEVSTIAEELKKVQGVEEKLPEGREKEEAKIIKEKKEEKLETKKEQQEKVEKEISTLKTNQEQIKGEKGETKKAIIEKTVEIIKPLEETIPKEKVPEEIQKIKKEVRENISSQLEALENTVKEKEEIKIEKGKSLAMDSDGDGLSDMEEMALGTAPFNPDSDGDGFLDGNEYAAGYDPLKPAPADKIIYQDPQKVKPKKADIYKVERVEALILPTGEIGLKFEGKGLPDSFITLYIFSRPVVVVVKTDENGHWEYTLDKVISDGQHTVYAAVTNNGGEIEARSETFVFTKIGEKAFRIFEAPSPTVTSPTEVLQRGFAILVAGIIVFGIGLALIIVGILTRKKREI